MPAPLTKVLASLEALAPLGFAEPWDNVGLLLEPVAASDAPPLAAALLTIDLSEQVVAEAEELGAGHVIAYHPPIFQGLKRLRSSAPAERALLRCATRGIAIFSPHTALDASPGGVNDWLLDAFGPGERRPCVPDPRDARYGQGRAVRLDAPISLEEAVAAVKRRLSQPQLRVAVAAGARELRTIAVCAGAGGGLFAKLPAFDLFVTGEMRHHDVLARVTTGSNVILSEHTHTERGYLPRLAEELRGCHPDVAFHVSACDRDPLALT